MGLAMASRRKHAANRNVGGRLSEAGRVREFPPAQVRRLRDAALLGMKDQRWGTELGRLYLAGRISEEQFAAGEWWTETAARFRASIGAFPVRSATMEAGRGGMAPDPDSDEGRKQAVREAEQSERFFEAHAALLGAGGGAEQAVRDVCERGLFSDLGPLKLGLSALATHRGLTRPNK